ADFVLLHDQGGRGEIDCNLGAVKIAGHGQFQTVDQKLHGLRLGIDVAAQLDNHTLAAGEVALHAGVQPLGNEMLLFRVGHEIALDLGGNVEFRLFGRQLEIGADVERLGQRDMPGFQVELAQLDLVCRLLLEKKNDGSGDEEAV